MRRTKLRVGFDVNGTLSLELMRLFLESLDRAKVEVVVWSSLGNDYAKKFCDKYELKPDEYATKNEAEVDIAIDDWPDTVSAAQLVLGIEKR